MVTYDDYIRSRKWCEDIGEALQDETLMGEKGYLYFDAYFIIQKPDGMLWTIVEKSEYEDADLGKLERILWNEWVKDEINS